MEKRCLLLRLCILCICACSCFLADNRTVKADLILDNQQIDGSHTIYFGGQPLREIQYGGTVVWRAGADITYIIDNNISETHFVPYGQSTLTVTGSKAGYDFIGWREDQTASGDTLTADLCTGDAKTLYAVFRKAVTVSYCNGSSTKQSSTGYLYYNNGNIQTPEFTIGQLPLSGWAGRGWSTGQAADAGVSYGAINGVPFMDDVTLYGLYQKTITASFDGNGAESGSVAALTGTAYYNSAGNTINPAFPMPANGFTKSGNAWAGWLQGSTGITRTAGESVTLSADTVFTAIWQPVVQNFGYTGDVQEWTVPLTGYYKLEAWGASGGTEARGPVEASGGPGGYACGYKYLIAGQKLYICCGQKGITYKAVDYDTPYPRVIGGYNGGGHGGGAASGGGATHIAEINRGVLANYDSYRSEILLVAGGGGGAGFGGESNIGGDGGGLNGGDGSPYVYSNGVTIYARGTGGTQTSGGYTIQYGKDVYEDEDYYTYHYGEWAGTFGRGGSVPNHNNNYIGGAGGGAGWYGGGAGDNWNGSRPGGGGSGYIGGVMPSLTYNGLDYVSTTTASGHTGNGTATITYLGN